MNTSLAQLDKNLDLYLVKKAPALPKSAKDAIVQFGPWVVLILFILSLPLILALFGLSALLSPFAMVGGVSHGMFYVVSMVILALSLVFEAMAIPGLFKRQRRAWDLMFYSVLLSALSNLLNFNIVGLIIGTLISLYILYQVKEYYK